MSEEAEHQADAEIRLSLGSKETVLPALAPDRAVAIADARGQRPGARVEAFSGVAARWPDCLDAWASLAEESSDDVVCYAFARVGYHRGLDALRASGWRGAGHVRWRHPENRGFLRSLEALRRAAEALGETAEEHRCAQFLRDLDPDWPEVADREAPPTVRP